MCGNAWSGFQYAAVNMTFTAAIGKFSAGAAWEESTKPEVVDVPDASSDDGSTSSDSEESSS